MPRHGLPAGLLFVALGCACGDDAGESVRDHDVLVTVETPIPVGGQGSGSAADACTAADHPDCRTDVLTITALRVGGSLASAEWLSSTITFTASQNAGPGTLTVTVRSDDGTASSGIGEVDVVESSP
jgi:hypothetical protein